MSFKIKDEDKGFNAFFFGLRDLAGKRATAGIQDANEAHEGGITMGELGMIHEYGAPGANIPQRSFIRSTADEQRAKYEKKLERAAAKLVKKPIGFSATGELLKIAESMRRDIIKKIDSNIPPPISESTLRSKKNKSDPALVDKGLLRGSIKAQVK